MTPPNSSDLARIEKAMGDGFAKLEGLIGKIDDRLRSMETGEAGAHGILNTRLTTMDGQLKDHEKRLDAIEKYLPAMRIMIWVGGIVSLSVIALIWAILTHAVAIVPR